MTLLEQIRSRRAIRKYLPTRVEKEKLLQIQEAGLYAPSGNGLQGAKIIMIDNPELIHRIGIVNAAVQPRKAGEGHVSENQPSILDDMSIKTGFYHCPALAIVAIPKAWRTMVNAIGDAFCCAENMLLEAYDLGVSSCIVGRGEATFEDPSMQALLKEWGLEEYLPIVFVCLGYIKGDYPPVKPRKEGRALYIE